MDTFIATYLSNDMQKVYGYIFFFLSVYPAVAQVGADSTQLEKDFAFVEKHRYDVAAKDEVSRRVQQMEKQAQSPFEKGLATFARMMSENSNHLGHNMGKHSHILNLKALNHFIEARSRHYQKLALMNFSNDYEVRFNLNNRFKSSKSVRYGTIAVRFDYDPDFMLTTPIYDDFTDREVSKSEMKEAINAFEKSYQYAVKMKNLPDQMYRLQKLGGYKFYLTQKFDDLEQPCLQSLAIADQLNDNFKTYVLGDLTVYANNVKEHRKAIKYGLRGYEHSRDSLKAYGRESIFLDQLCAAHKAMGNFEKAIEYKEKSADIIEEKYIKNDSKRNELLVKLNQELQNNLFQEKKFAESSIRQFWLSGGLILLSFVLLYFVLRNKQLKKTNKEISAAMLKGQATERKRVASDLHDNLGSTLSSIQWSLQAIDTSKMSREELSVHQNLHQMLDNAYNQVRLLSHNLLPEDLEKQGLKSALEGFVRKINKNDSLRFSLSFSENFPRLPAQTEFELYSICLELTNNILKHAAATEAAMVFDVTENILTLTVSDNGRGINEQ